jgi:dipeptide/tripeptide permease
MAYYGISSNLVVYLTKKLHEGTVRSSNNVTNWVGTIWMTPILGAYVADAHLGRYWTFLIASVIYLLVCMRRRFISLFYACIASRREDEKLSEPYVSDVPFSSDFSHEKWVRKTFIIGLMISWTHLIHFVQYLID